jgi:hypothetical protein
VIPTTTATTTITTFSTTTTSTTTTASTASMSTLPFRFSFLIHSSRLSVPTTSTRKGVLRFREGSGDSGESVAELVEL